MVDRGYRRGGNRKDCLNGEHPTLAKLAMKAVAANPAKALECLHAGVHQAVVPSGIGLPVLWIGRLAGTLVALLSMLVLRWTARRMYCRFTVPSMAMFRWTGSLSPSGAFVYICLLPS